MNAEEGTSSTGNLPGSSNQPIPFVESAGGTNASLPEEGALLFSIESSTRSDTGCSETLVVGTKREISNLERDKEKLVKQKLEVELAVELASNSLQTLPQSIHPNDKLKTELDELRVEIEKKDALIAELKEQVKNLKALTKEDINEIVDFENKKKIGDGSDGTIVYRAKHHTLEVDVAVKRMLKEKISRKNFHGREYRCLLDTTSCPYIVKLKGFVESDKTFWYLCLELCQGSLYEYVTMDRKFEFLSRPEVDKRTLSVRLLSQVLEGLQFLHSKDIIHRDLKPHNIMLCWNLKSPEEEWVRQMTPKISDLGLCKKLKEGESGVSVTKGLLGTLGWAAPELETGRITKAADIFTMGCVIPFVLFEAHPFGKEKLRCGNIEQDDPKDLKKADFLTRDLIEGMIGKESSSRPSCGRVRMHCLFWDEITQIRFFNAVNNRFPIKCRLSKTCSVETDLDMTQKNALKLLDDSNALIYDNISVINWKTFENFLLPEDKEGAKFVKQDGESARQLIRYLRNKMTHELKVKDHTAEAIEENLKFLKSHRAKMSGQPIIEDDVDKPTRVLDVPNDKLVLRYVTAWFPNLLVCTYNMAKEHFKDEKEFKEFFKAPEIMYLCS